MLRKSCIVGELPGTREMYTNTLHIAWPSITETFLVAMVGMVDTIMVGGLGAYAIAAVGLTNQPKFIILAIFLALNIGIIAVVSRRFGEKDREGANRCLRQVLLIAFVLSIGGVVLGQLYARPLLLFAGAQPDTIDASVTYFKIVLIGIPPTVLSLAINAAQRGVGNTRIAMYTNLAANLVNVLFNWLLITGHLGFPRLEVAGAAIATVLGNFVSMGIAFASISRPGGFLHITFKDSFLPDAQTIKTISKISSSAALEQLFLRIGFFIYVMIVANLGTDDYATHQICMQILSISFCFGDGLSMAASALVGQSLGRKRPDIAVLYGKAAQRVGMCISAVLIVLFLTLNRQMMGMFTNEAHIIDTGAVIIMFLALITTGQISQVVFSGCLRGAGDTMYVAIVSMVSIALIRPALSWYLCYPAGLGLIGAWYGVLIDQYLRLIFCGLRFSGAKWTKIKV